MASSQNKLEQISHFAAAISCIVAIVAVGIGVWQFNVSLELSDKQMQFIKQERNDRLNENIPILVVDSTEVADYNYHPFDCYSFSFRLSNIGQRPADSIHVVTYTVATCSLDNLNYEKWKKKSEPAYSDTTEYITPLNKGLHVIVTNFIMEPRKMQDYHIKTLISYYDVLLKKWFTDTYFYEVDFDKTAIAYHQPPKTLHIANKPDALQTDSLVKLYYLNKIN